MAFKKPQQPQNVPDSPDKILLDLPRRKIPGVLLHQGEVLKAYVAKAADADKIPDVALQLPTGSGKTLVGLLIAEWRRRKFKERVVYLCPTNQLVNQVAEQANDQYGLAVNAFTGPIPRFDPTAKAEYQNGDSIAVTSYSHLFNTNSYFSNADIVIADDAHSAENYIASLWSVRIDRTNKKHKVLHNALANFLSEYVGDNADRLDGIVRSIADLQWIDKIPSPTLEKIYKDVFDIIETHITNLDIAHPWSMIRDHLLACHIYLTHSEILIKPLIPPTWTHEPFSNPKQRIFMSATLGLGGDLERLTGRRKILRLPIPEGWDKQGIGRRFFMFPGMSLNEKESVALKKELMKIGQRSVVLVPSHPAAQKVTDYVETELGYPVFSAEDIERSKQPFVSEKKAVAVIAGRYDGIDFPGNDCKLLFIEALPKASNSQERFIMARMGANVLFNDRIQTRVLQAIGRCTRSLEDFSAVVVSGEELANYLADQKRRSYLHPELQAELAFGIEQSTKTTSEDLIENLQIFLDNGKKWEKNGNDDIVSKRASAVQVVFPAIGNLEAAVEHEIKYQRALWQGDYELAYECAEEVLAVLNAVELGGYRALWHYLAGSAARLAKIQSKDVLQFSNAKKAAIGISWLVQLSKVQTKQHELKEDKQQTALTLQLERIESILEGLGLTHTRNYNQREKEILEGLNNENQFETAHVLLGEILGFNAGKEESEGSPDPWWQIGDLCFVFEDNAGASSETLSVTKARQAASHPEWIREKLKLADNISVVPILVTSKTKVKEAAALHLKKVLYWPLDDFRRWADQGLKIIRQLRTRFSEPGDLEWRMIAMELFKKNELDAFSLYKKLETRVAANEMEKVR